LESNSWFFLTNRWGWERRNPQALLENVKENMRRDVANFQQGLIKHAQTIESLKSQIRIGETQEKQQLAKAVAFAKAGNTVAAAPLALDLKKTREDLAINREQMKTAEDTYQNLVAMRDAAIEKAKNQIASISSRLSEKQRNEAIANLTETASGMINEIGGHGDQLNRLEEIAEEGVTASRARMRVASGSLDASDAKAYVAERQALGDAALAELMAEQGIGTPDTSGTNGQADKATSMGPTANI
jgi:hypothetical protein